MSGKDHTYVEERVFCVSVRSGKDKEGRDEAHKRERAEHKELCVCVCVFVHVYEIRQVKSKQ